jgi:protein-arginine kinase activator protein McsA
MASLSAVLGSRAEYQVCREAFDMISACAGCGQQTFLIPLHGGKGGPLQCPLCVGKWNAEHGRRRRTGRVVIRAIKAFLDAGGRYNDIDKLKLSASSGDLFSMSDDWASTVFDPLGYMTDIARLDGADVDLTTELLDDTLRLAHPDCHPPERRELAHRVTQGLLALKPFVFPAPKPKPRAKSKTTTTSEPAKQKPKEKQSEPRYPCVDCADAVPSEYCNACRAEYDKREQKEYERRTAKQRAEYARRRQRVVARRPQAVCVACGATFKSKRDDARFCSAKCRQRGHRGGAVTDKNSIHGGRLNIRDGQRAILALVERHRAVFLNDILPKNRTRAQYQALSLAAAKLEAAGKIETWFYTYRYGKPGHKVLRKPGYEIEKPDQIPRLKRDERMMLSHGQ